jgi:hypothetical protein
MNIHDVVLIGLGILLGYALALICALVVMRRRKKREEEIQAIHEEAGRYLMAAFDLPDFKD